MCLRTYHVCRLVAESDCMAHHEVGAGECKIGIHQLFVARGLKHGICADPCRLVVQYALI